MIDCFMMGILLYCGNVGPPVAMFPQQQSLPTEYMAEQMVRAKQRPAASTTLSHCPVGSHTWDAHCTAKLGFDNRCVTGCAR